MIFETDKILFKKGVDQPFIIFKSSIKSKLIRLNSSLFKLNNASLSA